MAIGLSLNALVCLPISNSRTSIQGNGFPRTWSSVCRPARSCRSSRRRLVVEAKGKKGMQSRTFQRPPLLPKIEDDGNPIFVVFIRSDNVYMWYPLSIMTSGTTAKIIVAAKDNFVGKYLYKDTIVRNLAAVIYKVASLERSPKGKLCRWQLSPALDHELCLHGLLLPVNCKDHKAVSDRD